MKVFPDPITGRRRPEDDLLVAFIAAGWELFMPIDEAERVAQHLASIDQQKAHRLSGYLMRGEKMPSDIEDFVRFSAPAPTDRKNRGLRACSSVG